MSQSDDSAFDMVDGALRRIDAEVGTAECHGLLAGWVCAAGALNRDAWLAHVIPAGAAGAEEAKATLDGLRQAVLRQLNGPMLEFTPLLPDDEQPLAERTAALGEWCQGFLYGLSVGGIKDLAKLPADSHDAVKDFAELARAGSYDVEDGEEDERAYNDLVEYVRTAVLLVNEELHPTKAPPQDEQTLH